MSTKARDGAHRRRLRELLERSEIFGPRRKGDRGPVLRAADRDHLVRAAVFVDRRDGKELWAWGSRGKGVAVVIEGALDVQRAEAGAPKATLRRLAAGEEVGFSTLGGERHTAALVAAGRTTVAVLPARVLAPLLAARTGVMLRIFAHLGHLIGKLTDEKLDWRTQSVEDRVHAWVLTHIRPGEEVRVRHEDVAHFVGATRARVSEALEKLQGKGVIRLGRGSLSRPLRSRSGP